MNSPFCTRRDFLIAVVGALATIPVLSIANTEGEPASIADIEARVGGRVGFYAVDGEIFFPDEENILYFFAGRRNSFGFPGTVQSYPGSS